VSKLVGLSAEEISEKDFDPQGQYKAIVDAVKEAGDGEIGFYQAELDSTRKVYIVLGLDSKHQRVVGLKALAVES
jgi:hypothetical protein